MGFTIHGIQSETTGWSIIHAEIPQPWQCHIRHLVPITVDFIDDRDVGAIHFDVRKSYETIAVGKQINGTSFEAKLAGQELPD